jgi:thiol-disulfide isomerase/thioredoxin
MARRETREAMTMRAGTFKAARPGEKRGGERLRFAIAAILAWALAATAAAEGLPLARDLAADGRDARASGRVIVVLFSTEGCPYCERVREGFLRPMLAEEAKRVLIREIEVDGARPVVDFAGRSSTHREIGASRRVRFVPYVVFLGPDGESLAEPLIGINSSELYGGLLERRLETARARLGAH